MGRLCFVATVVAGVVVAGCASGDRKGGAAGGGGAAPGPGEKVCVMTAGGRDVLRVMMPRDAECTATEGELRTKAHDRYVELWLAPGAPTVGEGVERAGKVIESEFEDFKATESSEMVVAGSPAKLVKGKGTEADDGDPGSAEVVVFTAGGRVFIACAHGESLSPKDEEWLMAVVGRVGAP